MPTAAHEITEELTEDDIAARIARATAALSGLGAGAQGHEEHFLQNTAQIVSEETYTLTKGTDYRFFNPLANAAEEYINFARTPGERIYTGIGAFDSVMRGIAPRELLLVVGYAHSGKTVVTTEVILNNRNKRIIFFTPDETRVLVLVKLACLIHGLSAEELEERIANDDPEAIALIRNTAIEEFPTLAVFDDSLTIDQMNKAIAETEEAWGAKAQLLIYDYIDLLPNDGDTIAKVNAIKGWGKAHGCPLIALHQSSRTAGKDGQAVTISSGGFGGEQQATFLIGVRRKKSEIIGQLREVETKLRAPSTKDKETLHQIHQDLQYELARHANTVTLSLVKNKRPPSRLVDDLDFVLDQQTGKISEVGTNLGVPVRQTPAQAARQRQTWSQPAAWDDEEPF